jgi:RNA polymerase subunit RPABC4/transcription elongation factor Spt4
MEETENRVSFRQDKKTAALNIHKNKFGHTVTGDTSSQTLDEAVQVRVGGTGVEAYVDIFETPTMKKFMEQNNLDINEEPAIEKMVEIDLSEELEEEFVQGNYVRPGTLEEFDKFADKIIGRPTTQNQPQSPAPSTAKPKVFASAESQKFCTNCKCKIKKDAKFCPECGTPQTLAQFCKNCGIKFEGLEKFCSECGTKRE